MNPRQRRGVLFILLAGVGAIVLFFVVTSYVSDVNAQVGSKVTVYEAAVEIVAYEQITSELVQPVEMPERWIPDQAIRDLGALEGQRVSFNVAEGTLLGADMLLPPSDLSEDEREIAVEVDAITGIAGRLASGEFVDVYAVFAGDQFGTTGVSQVLVRNVRVVSVGGATTSNRQVSQGAFEEREVVPVTLALSADDALRVTYADAFANSMRLVGLPPGIGQENRSDETSSVDHRRLGLPDVDGGG